VEFAVGREFGHKRIVRASQHRRRIVCRFGADAEGFVAMRLHVGDRLEPALQEAPERIRIAFCQLVAGEDRVDLDRRDVGRAIEEHAPDLLALQQITGLERIDGATFGPELVLRGASERLAPILMTVLTTGLAMLPIVFLGDIPGLEIIRPMAIVVLGGLVTTTLLDLFVLPALYLRYGASREQELDLLPVTAVGEA